MAEIAVIGLDLAKTVFQVHGVSGDGEVNRAGFAGGDFG